MRVLLLCQLLAFFILSLCTAAYSFYLKQGQGKEVKKIYNKTVCLLRTIPEDVSCKNVVEVSIVVAFPIIT